MQNNDFTVYSDTTISVGHGNSMQLGNLYSNYAYISGWDDQKVYVVNLDTVTLADTITLPTTGYTTCAIDDVNGLAYIFQRDSTPSTEERYNFIVYDYVNDQIVSTKILPRPFGAIQGCDYVEGKIYVLNGLGTAAVPNYYLVYNTSGDIIAEYVIGSHSEEEPEGVYIDRVTKELYINYYSTKNVYKVT